MPRYQLKPLCVFVDGYDVDTIVKLKHPDRSINEKPNTDIKFAHIMDKTSGPPYPYLKLNDGAAFIARFIIQGVDTGLIAQILISEYNLQGSEAQNAPNEVNAVVAIIQQYLDPRTYKDRAHEVPESLGTATHNTGKYKVDFKVNQLGGGFIKGPL